MSFSFAAAETKAQTYEAAQQSAEAEQPEQSAGESSFQINFGDPSASGGFVFSAKPPSLQKSRRNFYEKQKQLRKQDQKIKDLENKVQNLEGEVANQRLLIVKLIRLLNKTLKNEEIILKLPKDNLLLTKLPKDKGLLVTLILNFN